MSNLERLIKRYSEDDRVLQIKQFLEAEGLQRIRLDGLVGAQDSFVLSGLKLTTNYFHLIISSDKEEAAYLQNNLSKLTPTEEILFFPDSFKRPQNFEELNGGNVLERTETINKISDDLSKPQTIVSYPEALFEKVVSPEVLKKSRIQLKKGEDLDIDHLIEVLVEYGFERVDFVYNPGQFSIRGGIIDIFSYGNEWPYRLDLFDEEIESIRTFDPTTQLSKRNIAFVNIVPNINTRFTQDQKVSLFEVLPSNTVIWVRDFQFMLDRLQQCFDKAEVFAKNLPKLLGEEEELREFFKDRAFLFPSAVTEGIKNYNIISLSKDPQPIECNHQVAFKARPQPSFNKNFKLLIEHLKGNTAGNIENFIFTDNSRQIDRFYSIFEDLQADITFHPILNSINMGFLDLNLKIACYTDHQIFERFHRFKLKRGFTKDQAINLKMLRELKPGDFVTHIDHGIGRYSGLEKITVAGHTQESVRLMYKNNDLLYVSINSLHKISRYIGKDGTAPTLSKIGSDSWKALKRKTKKKIKDIAKELIQLYAKRKASEGFQFPEDGYLQTELEASFIYEDTPDQYQATVDVKGDMEKKYPMDRLICGDVGFGKTEVAMRAAFKAIVAGKQVAILVPTTILALQHAKTFTARLDQFGCTVDYLNRFRTTKEKSIVYERCKSGEIDLVIGTHSLLNKKIGFKDLGLLIIDEEQKFGVTAKEKLRSLKVNVDTLTLTATPIPRTLQFSLMAARDLSVMRTPPPNRQPIHTERRVFDDKVIRESIYYEVNRGGQVFFVHNRVKSLPDITALIRRLCPDVDIAMAHGQMESKTLERTLVDFIDKKYDVLVCTNIIETGLDIPNANTIIINNANQFGMSDLHQLRGRVGRSNRKAYCYLFSPPLSALTPDARKRLTALEEFSDLGSGFEIAMKDLDIRGAGNLLGAEQSGFIADIGYETYQRILEEAIIELKETEFKKLFEDEIDENHQYVRDVHIETDGEMLIPDNYVANIQERLRLYTELDKIKKEEDLEKFAAMLKDRFGKLPREADVLFDGLRLRWLCLDLGFERLILKKGKLRCYFISNPQSPFYETAFFQNIIQYVAVNSTKTGLSFKKSNKYFFLVKDNVHNFESALKILKSLLSGVKEPVLK